MILAVLKAAPGVVYSVLPASFARAAARAGLIGYRYYRSATPAKLGDPLPSGAVEIASGEDAQVMTDAAGVLRRVMSDSTLTPLMPAMPRTWRTTLTTNSAGQVVVPFPFDPVLQIEPEVFALASLASNAGALAPSLVDGSLTKTGCIIQVVRPKPLLALTALTGTTISVASGGTFEGVPGVKVRVFVEERLS